MKRIGWVVLMAVSMTWGQCPHPVVCGTTAQPPLDCNCRHIEAESEIQQPAPQVAPLVKCGQYQHVEPVINDPGVHPTNAVFVTTYRCADDLHTVTEREWQDTQDRLKRQEERLQKLLEILTGKSAPPSGGAKE